MHASPDILKFAHKAMSFERMLRPPPQMQIRLSVVFVPPFFVQKEFSDRLP